MSVVSNSITLFVLDISAPMGRKRTVQDQVISESHTLETRTRQTTTLEWVCEFVQARIAEVILRGLKTTKVALISYGSTRTNNVVHDSSIGNEYNGIDEIISPSLPTLDTLDLVRSLRAVSEDCKAPPGDPLAALVDAIQLSATPAKGGIKESQSKTWKRTIYLVTDGNSPFSHDGSDAIKQKLIDDGIQLRVLGIDFDDPEFGVVEENKSKIKRENEEFWHSFLAEVPDARIATALDAIEQANMPNVQVMKPTPSKMALSFGDPNDLGKREAMSIPISLYKMTDVQRPMTQSKVSKLAQESAAAAQEREREARRTQRFLPTSTPILAKDETNDADDAIALINYKADIKREYFLLDEISSTDKGGAERAKPLAEGAEERFTKAWKLGASLIPVEQEAMGQIDTTKGIEILHFSSAEAYRREYNMDQIWYVFADPAQVKAQLQISSMVRGLAELDLIAVVRLVRRDGSEPELGVLIPCVAGSYDCFYYARVPFREDVRRFIFPPLDRIITKEGEEVRKGPSIPTEEDQQAMDDFVDTMSLPDGWFDILDSFNPAVHTLKSAVRHRFLHPDDTTLPGPHPELVKFVDTPREVRLRAATAVNACKDRFKSEYVPPKGNSFRKKRTATELNDSRADDSSAPSKAPKLAQQANGPQHGADQGQSGSRAEPIAVDDDSDVTEDEFEAPGGTVKDERVTPESEQALTVPSGDIGIADPVSDFGKLIESDDVTKAMVQMLEMIRYLLQVNEYDKLLKSIKAAKQAAQEYEEAIRWNAFVRSLKREIVHNHEALWEEKMKNRLEYGLVTEDEDEAHQSDVTSEDALEFASTKEV